MAVPGAPVLPTHFDLNAAGIVCREAMRLEVPVCPLGSLSTATLPPRPSLWRQLRGGVSEGSVQCRLPLATPHALTGVRWRTDIYVSSPQVGVLLLRQRFCGVRATSEPAGPGSGPRLPGTQVLPVL